MREYHSGMTTDTPGKDATEAFEDVGHSDEARAMLKKMLVGEFKGEVGFWSDPRCRERDAVVPGFCEGWC